MPLLGACSGERTGATRSPQEIAKVLPDYQPATFATPDLPGEGYIDPAYSSFPKELARSVPEQPGAGGEFTATLPVFVPPPPTDNAYWKAVNDALGASVRFDMVPADSYEQKLPAKMAGGSLSDLTALMGWALPPKLNGATQALFADLTPELGGDRIRDYPNLAAIPERYWRSCVFNGRLYGIPNTASSLGGGFFYHADIFAERGLSQPSSAEELEALCKELTDPRTNVWALGVFTDEIARMYGAPQKWRKTADGGLQHRWESDEFAEAVAFGRRLSDAGYVHPEGVEASSRGRQLFDARKIMLDSNGITAWSGGWDRQKKLDPARRLEAMRPYSHDGKTEPIYHVSSGVVFINMVNKKVTGDRLKELLRIENYLAAPFGTVEHLLVYFGVKGTHHQRDTRGAPVLSPKGEKELVSTYNSVSGSVPTTFNAKYPEWVEAMYQWQKDTAPFAVEDPTLYIYVEIPDQYSGIDQRIKDVVTDIIKRRRPVSDYAQAVEQWRGGGGDQIREVYQKALAQGGPGQK